VDATKTRNGSQRDFKECNDLARSLLLNAAEAVGKTVEAPPLSGESSS
jgi:hypothetical protein